MRIRNNINPGRRAAEMRWPVNPSVMFLYALHITRYTWVIFYILVVFFSLKLVWWARRWKSSAGRLWSKEDRIQPDCQKWKAFPTERCDSYALRYSTLQSEPMPNHPICRMKCLIWRWGGNPGTPTRQKNDQRKGFKDREDLKFHSCRIVRWCRFRFRHPLPVEFENYV